jgi:ribose 5-phosphate isomerase A
MNSKKNAAEKAVTYVREGMIVGLGTGTTAYWAIEKIGERVNQEKLAIRAIATSNASEKQARALGIPILGFDQIGQIDLTIDGADEADENMNLIKGGGGALLREKIVAYNSRELLIVVDESKIVSRLGRFPLPVEIAQFGWEKTLEHLAALGSASKLRMNQAGPFITDNGNYVADCAFEKIPEPGLLHAQINSIPGVMENGLFIRMATKLIVGYEDGRTRVIE